MQSSLLWWPTFAGKDVEIRTDDDVEEVEKPSLNSQSMNKTTTGHTCSACEKNFGSNRALEKHMDDKHQEEDCPFCDKTFPDKQGLKRHVNICIENRTTRKNCTHCNNLFNKFGLKRHTDQCTSKKKPVHARYVNKSVRHHGN